MVNGLFNSFRPILRTKSESDFPVLTSEEDVEEIRDKLIRDHNPSFHLKSVPSFSGQQKLVLASLALVDFTSFCSMSILAPFFPQKAEEKGVSTTMSGFIFSAYALVVFLGKPLHSFLTCLTFDLPILILPYNLLNFI